MKMSALKITILAVIGFLVSDIVSAQQVSERSLKDELKQINKRLLDAFPDQNKYSRTYGDTNSNSGRFQSTYKAKLLEFVGCNIKFMYSVSSEKVAYDDYLSFSLSSVLIARSSVRVAGTEVTVAINTEKDKISAKRSTGGVAFTGELPLKLDKISSRSSFSITLKTEKSASEVQNDFGRAVDICHTLKRG